MQKPSVCLTLLSWLAHQLFACRHTGAIVNEGKCYCPDCGKGLIFQWATLRCKVCFVQVESRVHFQRLRSVWKFCFYCGGQVFNTCYLNSPEYFQLERAQLICRNEQDYLMALQQVPLFEQLGKILLAISSSLKQISCTPQAKVLSAYTEKK